MSHPAPAPTVSLIKGGSAAAGRRAYHGVAVRTASGSYDLAMPPAMPADEAAAVSALLAAAPVMLEALRQAYLSLECRPHSAKVTAVVSAAIAAAQAAR